MGENSLIVGVWKFDQLITADSLATVAQFFLRTDDAYCELYIRQIDSDKLGLGFLYRIPNQIAPRIAHEHYIKQTVEYLRQTFRAHLIGWDVASVVKMVKPATSPCS